jgi:hypothetical protein
MNCLHGRIVFKPIEWLAAVQSDYRTSEPKGFELVEKVGETRKVARWCDSLGILFESILSASSRCFPSAPRSSGSAWYESLALSEESYESFEILGRCRQQKLFGDVPRPSQSHATQADAVLQF